MLLFCKVITPSLDEVFGVQFRSNSCGGFLQRLARSSTFGEYSHILSDVSKWSRSVSSIDEAQLDAMRKQNSGRHNNKATKPHKEASHNKAAFESRRDI